MNKLNTIILKKLVFQKILHAFFRDYSLVWFGNRVFQVEHLNHYCLIQVLVLFWMINLLISYFWYMFLIINMWYIGTKGVSSPWGFFLREPNPYSPKKIQDSKKITENSEQLVQRSDLVRTQNLQLMSFESSIAGAPIIEDDIEMKICIFFILEIRRCF